jgi:hypothetical protein
MALLIKVITIHKLVKVFIPWVFTSWGLLLQGYFFGNSKHGANSIKIQNLAKSLFSNVDLMWKDGFRCEG